jgi:exodeoxyribonuclease VII large subunit
MPQLPFQFRAARARSRAEEAPTGGAGGETEAGPRIFSVSELQAALRGQTERSFPRVLVGGEISNLVVHGTSGHGYFTLKDARAQLRCVMWRDDLRRLRFRLENGQEAILDGRMTVYAASGQLQLSVRHVELRGAGALQAAYAQLAAELREQGLTDPARKRPLPAAPRCVGVVTSRDGAALRDVLRTALQRDPGLHLVLSPCPVQGSGAAPKIARALERLDALGICDVILLVRGGGSVEDLWAFNEAPVARAIAACSVPVVTGVGHETDHTIVDLVADRVASTPTLAAALAVPRRDEQARALAALHARLERAIRARIDARARALLRLEKSLGDPGRILRAQAQHLDELEDRAGHAARRRLARHRDRLSGLERRLRERAPDRALAARRARLSALEPRLEAAMARRLATARAGLSTLSARLEALSPLAVLGRGYALVRDESGKVVRDADRVPDGARLEVRLEHGELPVRVERGPRSGT